MRLKKLAQLGGCLAGGVGAVLASSLFVACGGGDDSSSNVPTDASVATDGTVDGTAHDGQSTGNDASDGSASDVMVGSETSVSEASTHDGGADAADAGDSSTITDAAPDVVDASVDVAEIIGFFNSINPTYCERLRNCCQATPAQWSDGGFGVGCVATMNDPNVGGFFKLTALAASAGSGHLGFNSANAASCLQGLSTLACGVVQQTTINTTIAPCQSATTGTLDVDAGPCSTSLECKPGAFCQQDSSGSRCSPLHTQGQACRDTTLSTDCSYLGRGASGLQCDDPGDGGTPTCQPLLPTGATVGCVQNAQCQSLDCNSPACVTQFLFSDPSNHDPNTGICAGFETDGG
jgi:hypothetical protein